MEASSAVLPVAGALAAEDQVEAAQAEDQVAVSLAILAQAVGGRAEGQYLVPCAALGPVESTIPDNPAETASR